MDGLCGEGSAINSFSLVAYVPQPIAGFIERLRQEIEPGCKGRSHLTFLPPRPLSIPFEQIQKQLETGLRNQHGFRVELGEVRVFPVSEAIHLAVVAGWAESKRIHEILHQGDLCCKELFDYHPHVTIVHDLDPGKVAGAAELAKRRWSEYTGPRTFVVDHLTLVQNTTKNDWMNLGEFSLGVPVPA